MDYLTKISIHALRGEGDRTARVTGLSPSYFYPRPPWGGRQDYPAIIKGAGLFLSTPSVRRATTTTRGGCLPAPISIHALRGEGDGVRLEKNRVNATFLSTPSVGRATAAVDQPVQSDAISIHALRGEGDDGTNRTVLEIVAFLSTPSVGRATGLPRHYQGRGAISIHALSGEGDRFCPTSWSCGRYFYPRPPWGGRPIILAGLHRES